MLCNNIFKIIINFIIYIKGSVSIFIIYIGILGPLSHFDCTNFKVSLIIKIISFNGINKMVHQAMFVIFHVNVIVLSNFQFPTYLSHFCFKNPFFEMKIFKLITWYPNMVHMVQNFIFKKKVYLCF